MVKRDDVTRVPNTDAYVEGVVDLRGQITTILDPKSMMDIDDEGDQNLVVVFDPEMFEEQGAVGWIVDEVRQVSPVAESEVNSPRSTRTTSTASSTGRTATSSSSGSNRTTRWRRRPQRTTERPPGLEAGQSRPLSDDGV
ncbi:chemotaxis protein CheW [Halomicroarcula sp. GCM10025710]